MRSMGYLFILGLLMTLTNHSYGKEPPTIAVLSSENKPDGGTAGYLPEELAMSLRSGLTASRHFKVVERNVIGELVQEQSMGAKNKKSKLETLMDKSMDNLSKISGEGEGGAIPSLVNVAIKIDEDRKALVDYGSLVGADYLVIGRIRNAGNVAVNTPYTSRKPVSPSTKQIQLRVVDVKKGLWLGAVNLPLVGNWSERLRKTGNNGADDFSKSLVAAILDITDPTKISSMQPLTISRGASAGIKLGDSFSVWREGSLIDGNGDEVNLGRARRQVGIVKVIQVQDSYSQVEISDKGPVNLHDIVFAHKDAAGEKSPSLETGLPSLIIGKLSLSPGAGMSSDDSAKLIDILVVRLAQTRRFRLNERTEIDQMLDEQQLSHIVQHTDLPSELGTLKGADYLLLVFVDRMLLNVESIKIASSGDTFKKIKGLASGRVKLIKVNTGEVIAAATIEIDDAIDRKATNPHSLLMENFVNILSERVISAIFPLKVINVVGNSISIGRGRNGVEYERVGQLLDIVRNTNGAEKGNGLHADDGKDIWVARGRIDEIKEDRLVATLIYGDPPMPGDIVHPASSTYAKPVEKENAAAAVKAVPNW